jgi:hypothetical protein
MGMVVDNILKRGESCGNLSSYTVEWPALAC